VSFVPFNNRRFLVAAGNTVHCFDLSTLEKPKEVWKKTSFPPPPHRDDHPKFPPFDAIYDLAWETSWANNDRPRPYYWATAQTDHVVVWEFLTHPRLVEAAGGEEARPLFSLAASADIVRRPLRAVCFAPPDDRYICGASADKTVYVWDRTTRKMVYALGGHTHEVHALAASPNGQILASGSAVGEIILWNLPEGKQLRAMEIPIPGKRKVVPRVSRLLFWEKNKLIAAVRDYPAIHVWNVTTGKQLQVLEAPEVPQKDPPLPWVVPFRVVPERGFTCLARCGRYLIAGEDRFRGYPNPMSRRPVVEDLPSTIFVWDLESGKPAGILSGHAGSIKSISVSPDGRYLLSTDGRDVRLWELNLPR
jgi:WD40 repeat protein